MIRLTLFGRRDLLGDDGQPVEEILRRPKSLAVLIYLVLAGPGGVRSRDSALALFWPESTEKRARHGLTQVLLGLRGALGEGVIVNRGRGEVGVRSDAIWCDAVEFDQALNRGDDAEALSLYRGELLPGFFVSQAADFDHWLSDERDRCRRSFGAAAWRLSDSAEKRGDLPDAARWAERVVEAPGNDEIAIQRHIRLLDRMGDRVGALRVYESFKRRLAQELDVLPSAATRDLVAQIRSRSEPSADALILQQDEAPTTRPDAGELQTGAATTSVASSLSDASQIAADRARTRRRRPFLLVASAAMATIIVCAVGWGQRNRIFALTNPSDDARTSISVAGFAGTDPLSVQLGRTLTGAVVNKLVQVSTFDVTAPELVDVSRVKRAPARPPGSQLLLTGDIERSAHQVRVTVRIADVQSGRTIKSRALNKTVAADPGDIDADVDVLAGEIASLIRTTAGHEVRLRRWRSALASDSAYKLLLQVTQARDLAVQLQSSGNIPAAARALNAADSTARAAERIAGNSGMLLIERAQLLEHIALLHMAGPLLDSAVVKRALTDGMREATRAVSLDPHDAGALEAFGELSRWYWSSVPLPIDSGRRVGSRAEQALDRAVGLDPQRAEAWVVLSGLRFERADFTGAYLAANRAYAADQYMRNPAEILSMLSLSAFEIGDDSASTRWCAMLEQQSPGEWPSSYCELNELAALGVSRTPGTNILARAWTLARNSASSGSDRSGDPMFEMLTASVLARSGLRDSAIAVMRRAAAHELGNAELLPLEAQVRTLLGQYDTAAVLLDRYFAASPLYRAGVVRSRRFHAVPGLQQGLTREGVPLADR